VVLFAYCDVCNIAVICTKCLCGAAVAVC
jgi:hypothetical protein